MSDISNLAAAAGAPGRRGRSAGAAIPPPQLTYTLQNAALVSDLSEDTLRRRAAEGKLRLVKVEGRTLVDAASLRRMLGLDTAA